MSNITSNIFTSSQIFPKYVCDETLRRAAQVDNDGNTAIRVIANDEEPDLTEIKQRIGAKDETKWDNSVDTNPGSVISILKAIENKMTPIIVPPETRVLSKVVNEGNGDEVPFSSFQSIDLLNPTLSMTANSYVLYIAPTGNFYELAIYIRASGSETLDLTTIPQYSDPADGKYYHIANEIYQGFEFQFTNSGILNFNPCRAQSANFGSSHLIVSSNAYDFSTLFS